MVSTKSLQVICVVLAVSGCKPQATQSKVSSLENFSAQSTLKRNRCEGSAQAKMQPSVKALVKGIAGASNANLQDAVGDAASAVPATIRDLFVELGGEVVLTDDLARYCGSDVTGSSGDAAASEGCYRFVPAEEESQVVLQVISKADETAVRHGLVRSFGYLYSQLLSRLTIERGADGVVLKTRASERAGLLRRKTSLTNAYFYDLGKSPVFRASDLDRRLGAGVTEKILQKAKSRDGDVLSGVGLSDDQARSLRDAIFAEAFDSYFCSAYAPIDAAPLDAAMSEARGGLDALKGALAKTENSRLVMSLLFHTTLTNFNRLAPTLFGLKGYEKARGFGLSDGGFCTVDVGTGEPEAGFVKAVTPEALLAGNPAGQSVTGLEPFDLAPTSLTLGAPTTANLPMLPGLVSDGSLAMADTMKGLETDSFNPTSAYSDTLAYPIPDGLGQLPQSNPELTSAIAAATPAGMGDSIVAGGPVDSRTTTFDQPVQEGFALGDPFKKCLDALSPVARQADELAAAGKVLGKVDLGDVAKVAPSGTAVKSTDALSARPGFSAGGTAAVPKKPIDPKAGVYTLSKADEEAYAKHLGIADEVKKYESSPGDRVGAVDSARRAADYVRDLDSQIKAAEAVAPQKVGGYGEVQKLLNRRNMFIVTTQSNMDKWKFKDDAVTAFRNRAFNR